MSYIELFKKETSLIKKLGEEKAHLAWVMARYLQDPDINALAAAALTDGPNDKKNRLYISYHDEKRLVFSQGYYATKPGDSAPANKASDLNTAAAWLLSGHLNDVPKTLRAIIEDCRAALAADEIDTIELLDIHNLPESVNVVRELQTVEDHLKRCA